MDDSTRSIIRNVKGPGMFPPKRSPALANEFDGTSIDHSTNMYTQSVRTTFSACSSLSVKPDVCDKRLRWRYDDDDARARMNKK